MLLVRPFMDEEAYIYLLIEEPGGPARRLTRKGDHDVSVRMGHHLTSLIERRMRIYAPSSCTPLQHVYTTNQAYTN